MHLGCRCCSGLLSRRSVLGAIAATPFALRSSAAFAAPASAPDIEKWLAQRPRIASFINWYAPGSADLLPYGRWPAEWRSELQNAFNKLSSNAPLGLPDPPTNLGDVSRNETRLSVDDARGLFFAFVAQSLAVEIGRRVSWSIEKDSDASLAALLSGNVLFEFDTRSKLYRFKQWVVPAPPDIAYQFLVAQGIIGPTRLATIGHMLQWCTDHLVHFLGDMSIANMEKSWQYRGWPPVSRVLAGTVYTGGRSTPRQHLTMGCWGTTGFITAMLRTLNIPVERVDVFDNKDPAKIQHHATTHFISEDLFLSHGDDPYSALIRVKPSFASIKLLFGRQRFHQWFESGPADNVGRQVYELALADPSIHVLNVYASDMKAGSATTGQLAKDFGRYFTADELDKLGFWGRLDTKLAQHGGVEGAQKEYAAANAAYQKSLNEP